MTIITNENRQAEQPLFRQVVDMAMTLSDAENLLEQYGFVCEKRGEGLEVCKRGVWQGRVEQHK